MTLEEEFVEACKTGNIMLVMLANLQKVDLNYMAGWGLRRAIRFNQPLVWKYLLTQETLDVNVENQNGQSPLHIACRYNNFEAVTDLLKHPNIELNKKCALRGLTPIMVTVKYGMKEAFEALISDKRIDLETDDPKHQTLEQVAVALCCKHTIEENNKKLILEGLENERTQRKEQNEFQKRWNSWIEKEKRQGKMERTVKMVTVSGIVDTRPFEDSKFKVSDAVVDEGYITDQQSPVKPKSRRSRILW